MGNLTANFSLGWDADSRTHNAVKTRQAVIGDAFGYLMAGGDAVSRRFASTVLDQMGFTRGKVDPQSLQLGRYQGFTNGSHSRQIDFIHRKLAGEIYASHLAKPFMSAEELPDYIFENTISQKPEYLDLLTGDGSIEEVAFLMCL